MDPEHIIILVEGKNDVEFILNNVLSSGEKVRVEKYVNKDKVLRKIINRNLTQRIVIINEEGKSRLIKNINKLVSKARSIGRDQKILVVIDSNHSRIQDIAIRIYDNIAGIVNNKRIFPKFTPTIPRNKNHLYYKNLEHVFMIPVVYSGGGSLTIYLLVVPRSLEEQLRGRYRDEKWFYELCYILGRELRVSVICEH